MSDWLGFEAFPATPIHRQVIEALAHAPIASDACIIIASGGSWFGWGDDYGTFHPVCPEGEHIKEAAEAFLEAVSNLAAATI